MSIWKNNTLDRLRSTPPDRTDADSGNSHILYVGWRDPRPSGSGGTGKYLIARITNYDQPDQGFVFELADGNFSRPAYNWADRESLTYTEAGG